MDEQEEEFTPTPLDDFVGKMDDEPAAEPSTEAEPKTEEPPADEPTGETEEAPAAEAEEAEPEPDSPPESEQEDKGDKTVPYAALADERRKRQQLEAKVKELEAEPPADPPSVFEDEKGFVESIRNDIQGVKMETRLEVSHALMAEQHGTDKVNEAFEKFNELRQDYPQLARGFADSNNPFKYAMDQVEKFENFDKLQGADYETEVNKKAEELAKQMISEMNQEQTEDADVPDSMAAKSSAGVSSSGWAGPTPLEDIVDQDY